MIIQSPQIRNIISTISWAGDIYQIGGKEFDFSPLLDGEILPQEALDTDLIISDVTRVGTEIFFTYIRTYKHEGSTRNDTFPPALDNTKDSV